jgi:hypothetical protein
VCENAMVRLWGDLTAKNKIRNVTAKNKMKRYITANVMDRYNGR